MSFLVFEEGGGLEGELFLYLNLSASLIVQGAFPAKTKKILKKVINISLPGILIN